MFQSRPPNRSRAWSAKRAAIPACLWDSTFTPNRFERFNIASSADPRSKATMIIGGSRDNDEKALTVQPCGCPPTIVVTTVTGVHTDAIASRNCGTFPRISVVDGEFIHSPRQSLARRSATRTMRRCSMCARLSQPSSRPSKSVADQLTTQNTYLPPHDRQRRSPTGPRMPTRWFPDTAEPRARHEQTLMPFPARSAS